MEWPVCKLQVYNLVLIQFAQAEWPKIKKKHPKLDGNIDIVRQSEQMKYEMSHTLVSLLVLKKNLVQEFIKMTFSGPLSYTIRFLSGM